MPEESGDSYERLLTEWYARRTLVDAYHRSLRFLMAHNGDTSKPQQELVEKLGDALTALRATNDQMRSYEQEHGAPNSQ
jgi:DnaJ-domain-containing protein 1